MYQRTTEGRMYQGNIHDFRIHNLVTFANCRTGRGAIGYSWLEKKPAKSENLKRVAGIRACALNSGIVTVFSRKAVPGASPDLRDADKCVVEGDGRQRSAEFMSMLLPQAMKTVTEIYSTGDGTANVGSDYGETFSMEQACLCPQAGSRSENPSTNRTGVKSWWKYCGP